MSAPTSGLGGPAVEPLQAARAGLDELLDLMHVAVATYDADLCCIYANRRARDLLGQHHGPPADLRDTLPSLERDAPGLLERLLLGPVTSAELTLERDRHAPALGPDRTSLTVDRVLSAGRRGAESDALTPPPRLRGAPQVWRLYLHRTRDASGACGVGLVALDVTRHRSYVAALTRQARVDSLTGLHNRRELHEHLSIAVAAAQQGHASQPPRVNRLYLLDLDDFKLVNDTYGHPAGDTVLRAVGARLTGVMRSGDVAARLGGDEFAILCRDLDAAGAAAVTRRIRTALSRPIALRTGVTTAVTASLGAVVIDGALTAEELLASADTAMYAAKRRRRRPAPRP